jgi:hypothetical protein
MVSLIPSFITYHSRIYCWYSSIYLYMYFLVMSRDIRIYGCSGMMQKLLTVGCSNEQVL